MTDKSFTHNDAMIVDEPASDATGTQPVALVNNTAVLLYDHDDLELLL